MKVENLDKFYISYQIEETLQHNLVHIIFYLLEHREGQQPKIHGKIKLEHQQRNAVANTIYKNLADISNNLFLNAHQRQTNAQEVELAELPSEG